MTLTLEVNGTEFSNFTDATATIALDQFVNTFSFGASSQEPQGFPVQVGDEVRVLADGEVVVTGFVEGLRGAHSANSRTIQITGSSLTADVLDSTINQIVLTTPISLQAVIEAILGEINSPLTVTNEVDGLENFEKSDLVAAEPGQGAFDLIEQYARKRQVLIRTGTDGNILISRNAGATPIGSLLSRIKDDNNNVKSATLTIDRSNQFNIYIARSQQNQIASFNVNEDPGAAAASDQSGEVIDPDIRATRTLTFIAENSTTNDGLIERAKWEADVRRARFRTYTATVVGHSVDGSPWAVNETVQVIDEWEDLTGEFLIDQVTFRFSANGAVTELRCVAPDAYTLQASEPVKQKETDIMGGVYGG